MSEYRTALDQTAEAVRSRSQAFRDLIIAVALTGLTSVGSMIALPSLRPSSALLLFAPLVYAFLWRDHVILGSWRKGLGEAWTCKRIDFAALRHTLAAHPTLPRSTVQGMLDTLPAARDLSSEQRVSSCTREGVMQAVTLRDDSNTANARAVTLALGVGALSAILAAWSVSWYPLLALGVVPCVPIVIDWQRRRRIATTLERIKQLKYDQTFVRSEYRELVAALAWETGNRQQKVQLLDLQ